MRTILFLCVILAACTTAAPAPCTTQAGTFAVDFTPTSGDCAPDFATAFAAAAKNDAVKVAESCYQKSASSAMTVTVGAQDCQAAVSGTAAGDASGYTGTAAVAFTCPDGTKCQQAFVVKYAKK